MNSRAFLSVLLMQPLESAVTRNLRCQCRRPAFGVPSFLQRWIQQSLLTWKTSKIVRDRVHITLTDGTIQFVQPANGVVFGAVFRGNGRVQADPPNQIEAQQLFLFTKQAKLDMPFTDATFSFTDGLLEEVAKQVKWQGTGPAADELYAKRQQEREDLGAEYLRACSRA